ncbi:MAG: YhjD/YihY/BrkB family envelope integrity protein [Pseudomonadota bacterium]
MPGHRERAIGVFQYLNTDIWRMRLADMPPLKRFWVRQLRVLLLSMSGFVKDRCTLRASSLTFFSLLAVVPVAAMAFGIAKGFGFRNMLERQLIERLPGQEAVISRIIEFAEQTLATAKGGLIAGVGITLLFYTVLKVLSNIEEAFNRIWGITTHRTLVRKFSDYLSMMFTAPLLVLISGSLTVFISSEVIEVSEQYHIMQYIGPAIYAGLKLLSTVLLWLLFTLIYVIMPNTRVRLFSGFVGGIIAGSAYQIAQWIYVSFQIGAARYNAIYGSFAALPLFIIWIQISWLIVLFGAEMSYAHQNADIHEHEPDYKNISPRYNKLLALQIAHLLVKQFITGEPAMTAEAISHRLQIPLRLVERDLGDMVDRSLVSRTHSGKSGAVGYQPARDPHFFTVTSVLEALDKHGVNQLPIAETPELEKLSKTLNKFEELLKSSPDNLALKDL